MAPSTSISTYTDIPAGEYEACLTFSYQALTGERLTAAEQEGLDL